jgi:hypothetical protein
MASACICTNPNGLISFNFTASEDTCIYENGPLARSCLFHHAEQCNVICEWMSLFALTVPLFERCVSIVAGTPSSSTLQLEEFTPLVSISAATSANSQSCPWYGMVYGMVFPEQLLSELHLSCHHLPNVLKER